MYETPLIGVSAVGRQVTLGSGTSSALDCEEMPPHTGRYNKQAGDYQDYFPRCWIIIVG